AEALNGRLAGVTATTAEGSPDADIKIRVRGGGSITQDNSPLYIVDGVQVESGLNGIVLQDIQDITVLKDAAAVSVYGARGANGVIIITTKSGKIGEPKVTYNMFYGIKSLPKTLGVMSPYEFVLYNYERNLGSTTDSSSFGGYFGPYDTFVNYKNAKPVDWQREVLGNKGHSQMHNIGISGGANKWTYNFSYTYNDDKAVVLNSAYKRHQVNFKNEFKLSSKLKATLGTRYTNQTVFGAGVSDDKGTAYNRLRNAVKYRPFLSPGQDITEEDPFADDNPGNGLGLINPYQIVNAEYRRKTTNQYAITASLTYTINKHLTFKSTFGYDKKEITDRQFTDSTSSLSVNYGSRMPVVELDTTKTYTINNSNILTYSLKNYKKKHDIELIVGEETVELNGDARLNLSRYYPNFISKDDAFNNPNLGQSDPAYPKHNAYKSTQLSFFGTARYSYLKKYLFTFVYRTDGSSKFINQNRWGNFMSGSAAWRVSNEKFMDKVKFINDLKIRASYGAAGNNRIGDYLFLSTFNNQTYYYGINGQQIPAYSTSELANEKLKWEALVNMNIGFDMTILKNRLDISVDYFRNKSSDLLLRVPIAPTFGFTSQTQNIGKTSSEGVEIQLSASILQKKNALNWNSSFNISFSKNRVDELGLGMQYINTAPSWGVNGPPSDYITQIGKPVGSMVGYIYDGFYTTEDFNYNTTTQQYTLKPGVVNNSSVIGTIQPGSIKFKDLNGDSLVDNSRDRTIVGNPNPKFTGGWNNQFSYKNWDLSLFINFSVGNDVYNANKIEFTNGYINRSNLIKEMEGRWRTIAEDGTKLQWIAKDGAGKEQSYGAAPTVLASRNTNANMWMPLTAGGAFHSHSWAIEDGSFVRINNLTLGYSFPIKTLVKLGISKLRIYATANNLAVITKYTGYDPEVSVSKNPLTPGLDYSAYPKSRSFLFGLNVTF
ncbi:MAG: SusC/RagA family TonB-linked outer membrane protein, partial [Bacteroidetes bacterium]|nr:SusC/RagA family TonB-linked outer membrane protein [Bacteroidota bacterium]